MKYKLFIRQYDLSTNGYKTIEKIISTNDIYHEIGKIYCNSILKIDRIDYLKIDEKADLQARIDKALHRIQLLQMDGEVSIKDLGKIVRDLRGSDKE